ncbi:MAG TPA: aminoacyl--tRNA ligase-related protein [Steroidobacteraceae bacterium]|nr:aminoacyl--tRNA ligase-related protein [Steroidobacteraceae bacterium]
MQNALAVTRAGDFAAWYQEVVDQGDLAEESGVRGCMIIRPWGYGVWQRMQELLDRRFRDTGHENCYFPLFIPLSYIAREAEHVEGFAKEMAVVTHHRLKMIDGVLKPDPEAKLEEPLIVRPTSETVIGAAFHRWVRSHRDLPLLLNQWANVVRWEMRPRLFLRTSEFLWQEGHTAHATAQEARAETARMLEVYRSFSEDVLAMPVVAGEKPAHERFPGADNTYSIEAMMQDGKALQAGTAHYLGTNFAEAQSIRYQTEAGDLAFAHTTSWGVSTRLVGGVVMTHGDDDGLRLPPIISPRQIVLIPMLRDKPEDAGVLEFCEALVAQLNRATAFGEPVRALLDRRPGRAIDKRWAWIKRGVPVICDLGARDVAAGNVSYIRRDQLRNGEKILSQALPQQQFVAQIAALLSEVHAALYTQAKQRLTDNIRTDITTFEALAAHFACAANSGADEDAGSEFRGWARVAWARPAGAALATVEQQLKSLKLTVRNAPLAQDPITDQRCIFSGEAAREFVLVGRSY